MILATTGHRPGKLGGYGPETDARCFALALQLLDQYRPERLLTGMALGWDSAVARACVLRGVPFVAAIPCERQDAHWPNAAQLEYERLLALAERVVMVSPGGYHSEKMRTRNCWMVDNADGLVALWDGSKSGTSHCVKYAESRGKPVVNLWPFY